MLKGSFKENFRLHVRQRNPHTLLINEVKNYNPQYQQQQPGRRTYPGYKVIR